mmetsp:Transcript_4910/g.13702  ORF Transcript_4910/g.13702 Transcript_4910/m.13702 type:complete len:562 (-) Transcript_4910:493-2178(-)
MHGPCLQPQVKSGHFVPVKPTPLGDPRLVIHSPAMAAELGISEEEIATPRFAAFFSGDMDQVEGLQSWATPYALSIMGERHYSNCPFGNGNGYGDGRAVSVGEVVVNGKRWEMQLKGGGQTPFCRRADGRAVLRSSIREFLASEAMHNLGIETTRALSLVVSGSDTVHRPWYSEITEDDPRLADVPAERRRAMLKQKRDPDVLIEEPCAITTRVAPSFLRVGHIDLFSRRATADGAGALQREELEKIVNHALFREYPDILQEHESMEARAAALLETFGGRLAALIGDWLRVGFCQGNFNADNCLVGGRTMDYGPFGFMDEYNPLFAKWTGSGSHFAFMNQPGAALANFHTLALSLAPLLCEGKKGLQASDEASEKAATKLQAAVSNTFREKLGFPDTRSGSSAASTFWPKLNPLIQKSKADYTVFFRQLSAVAELPKEVTDEELMNPLTEAFYQPLPHDLGKEIAGWLRGWRAALEEEAGGDTAALAGIAARMRTVNPKYIPREWMLVEAYDSAQKGDGAVVNELFRLFESPYDEQPEMEAKYYRRAPDTALLTGGTAFMS